jgi:cytochrome c peroxidase
MFSMAQLLRFQIARLAMVASPVLACVSLSTLAAAQTLPPPPVPPQNPITESKRVLGKILFWDEQLSTSNVVSCGTCHVPARAGADDRLATHPGIDGIIGTPDDVRGSPGVIASDPINDYIRSELFNLAPQLTGRAANSMINAAYATDLFWDGRARSQFVDPISGEVIIPVGGGLESQAVGPVTNDVEMAHLGTDWNEITVKLTRVQPLALATAHPADVAQALATDPGYPELFEAAFGDDEITAARIGMAIATYERTLISNDSPWDRTQAGLPGGLTPQQQQGWQAFQASRCNDCHQAPFFSDHTFRNIGLRPIVEDIGRQAVTGLAGDRGRFKVPSLRNVNLKRTFMHNGQFTTIPEVIAFYARAPGAPQQFLNNQDPLMAQVNVPPQAAQVITAFLNGGLTDPRVAASQFPFDRPTLFVDRPADQAVLLGGGVAGTGGVVPRIIVQAPPMVGNMEYRVGLDAPAALGGSTARLAVSLAPPVNGRINPNEVWNAVTIKDAPDTAGVATWHWPLEAGKVTPGQQVWMQWIVDDDAAPNGQSLSNVARITLFCGSLGCPDACTADYDGNGTVAVPDIFAFLSDYFAGRIRADVNGFGGVNVPDIFAFLALWFGGC